MTSNVTAGPDLGSMMPVQTEGSEDYKAKYKTLKRKLKLLIYENECFQEELRKAQRALLRVRRDKSFLLDRLLQYQRGPDSSSDSEQTEDSDTEVETKSCRKRLSMEGAGGGGSSNSPGPLGKPPPAKKKKSSSSGGSGGGGGSTKSSSKHSSKQVQISNVQQASSSNTQATAVTVAGAATVRKLTAAQLASAGIVTGPSRRIGHIGAGGVVVASGGTVGVTDGQLTREEVERRLAARQPMNDYTTTTVSLTLPNQLFSDIMEGTSHSRDFKEEEIDTSPSNIDDDITVDNYD
ncbi:hypothetical protein Pmani_012985 [Petrolisthes manimaculis]|uniref:INO80 complex subunit E N-terminal domain-containing protein n=1 Tax=Petrolisthes manimaculis TaxID=1843537 RepID=A0AAE1UCP0_9EUCA|nr:hypothetical protein Pmani_012985 [Petrolisthes manimaculis]